MKRSTINALLISVTILACSCNSKQPIAKTDLAEAKKAIAESNALYFESFAKNDSTIFIDRYAEDCCIMGHNAPALCGPDAPAKFFRTAYDQFGLRNGKFITTEIFSNGDEYATEAGLWQSFNADGKMFDDGKFLVLWKKTPKGWKMFRDSFSSNRQPVKN